MTTMRLRWPCHAIQVHCLQGGCDSQLTMAFNPGLKVPAKNSFLMSTCGPVDAERNSSFWSSTHLAGFWACLWPCLSKINALPASLRFSSLMILHAQTEAAVLSAT